MTAACAPKKDGKRLGRGPRLSEGELHLAKCLVLAGLNPVAAAAVFEKERLEKFEQRHRERLQKLKNRK